MRTKGNILKLLTGALLLMMLVACNGGKTTNTDVTNGEKWEEREDDENEIKDKEHESEVSEGNAEKDANVNEIGNMTANIHSGGTLGLQGEWLYYCNGKGTYKCKTDGTERQFLTLDLARDINVIGDRMVFRISGNNGENSSGIYSMKVDGTEIVCLDTLSAEEIIVVGETIYYTVNIAVDDVNSGLYKINIDGSGKEKLFRGFITHFDVVDDWIYFSSYEWVSANGEMNNWHAIYKMKTDGTKLQKVIYAATTDFIVKDDWIYFLGILEEQKECQSIYRIKTDGTELQSLYKTYYEENNTRFDSEISYLNVLGDWVYYDDEYSVYSLDSGEYIESGYGVFKMKTDGTERQMVEDKDFFGDAYSISYPVIYKHMDEEYVYFGEYSTANRGGVIYKRKWDGTGKTIVLE